MTDLNECLSRQRCVFLQATDKTEAIEELVRHLCRSAPELHFQKTVEEVLAREKQLSTRIAPHVAIPHAQFDDLTRTYIAVGRSRSGIVWEAADQKEPVPLVILIVGGRKQHLKVLSTLASLLEKKEVIDNLMTARDPAALYHALASPEQKGRGSTAVNAASRDLLGSALVLAEQLKATALLIHLPPDRLPEYLLDGRKNLNIVFVVEEADASGGDKFPQLAVPFKGGEASGSVKVSLLLALAQGLVKKKDTIISLFGQSDPLEIDSLTVSRMSKDFDHFFAIPVFGEEGDIELQVFLGLLEIARELAREGREGKPVGALFVLGDHRKVARCCQQMVVNPFKGYDETERNVLDPSMAETLKEFSRIDGAIVIRGDGVIVSAGTYLRPDKPAAPLPPGLGARHAAAAGITAVSNAVSLAISESTRQISVFHGGERIMVL